MEELEERIGVMVEVLDMGTIMNKVAITTMMKMIAKMAKITKYGNHSCNTDALSYFPFILYN